MHNRIDDLASSRATAESWGKVVKALDEVAPGWHPPDTLNSKGDNAVIAIRLMAEKREVFKRMFFTEKRKI